MTNKIISQTMSIRPPTPYKIYCISRLHMNASEAKIKAQKKCQLSKADLDNIVKDCKSGKSNPGTVAQLKQVCQHYSIPHEGKKKADLVDIIAKNA